MIYVIAATRTEFVKIGFAVDPIRRLKALQIGIPMTLVLLGAADWSNATERRIHRVLQHRYVRGEWYRHGVDINSLINHMQSGASSADVWLDAVRQRRAADAPSRLSRVMAIA